MHFFDEHASLKLSRDEDNLRVVNQLQRELNQLKMFKLRPEGARYGYKGYSRLVRGPGMSLFSDKLVVDPKFAEDLTDMKKAVAAAAGGSPLRVSELSVL
jgi:hypothetical protein